MATKYVCDKCGKIIGDSVIDRLELRLSGRYEMNLDADLHDKCADAFIEWLENEFDVEVTGGID